MEWSSEKIRDTFFRFFKSKAHEIVPSAPIVVKNDPTLMFTNAGMNQFKDVFLGNREPQQTRVANSQKCLRVSGKHNDLEEVGVDTYHHTMFEMLGNWSFGDYFKEEAIHWAWELLTEFYHIEKDRMYVTVFEGNAQDQLPEDMEAYKFWQELVPEERILKGSKKDNFWEMGDTGPCGPCSEIHVDLRDNRERKKTDGKNLVNQDHPLVIEIWNLVFMEYNRMADGALKSLPMKHVDTGMGFERLAMILQGKQSNYDTDIFHPLINKIENMASIKYGAGEKTDIAIKVIADHIRAVAFCIADGQLPSNTGAGYVIRRILRRAIRYGYSFLDLKSPFFYKLVPVLAEFMGKNYAELKKQQPIIEDVIREEEESFLRTLSGGIEKFNRYVKTSGKEVISGKFAFELYDTYGFPIDLTRLLASEQGFQVDMDGFEEALQQQKDRSRKATKITAGDWEVIRPDDVEEFVGYDELETAVQITRYRKIQAKEKTLYQLVFNITPFYPEGGGQVGDTGFIESNGEKISITDTRKENEVIVHFTKALPTDLTATFTASVDRKKRLSTANNHTATHLLHEALREVLGDHVEQKGSLVHPDYLRFDFSHFAKVKEEELKEIEKRVNRKIRQNLPLEEKRAVPVQEAKTMGAMALFGEKYGDVVRVIRFGSSVELCGGTHVAATGNIGLFRIVSESAIAAGIRRIEAITSEKAEEYFEKEESALEAIRQLVKNPKDPVKAVKDLLKENAALIKKVEAMDRGKAATVKEDLLKKAKQVNGIKMITEKVDLDPKAIKDIAFQLKSKEQSLFLVLGTESNGKANLTVMVTEDLVKGKGLHAGKIIKELAKLINGGGGGQAFFASAGGSKVQGIEAALKKAEEFI